MKYVVGRLSTREALTVSEAILDGIRVLDLTTFIAAPQCGRALAALGADVVKVEAPEKDFYRIESPLFEVGIPCTDEENPIFLNANAGKRLISLNLKTSEGKKIFEELAKRSDILITNMRQAALEKLGIDYEHIRIVNPKLVYGHLDGYGQKGPEAPKPGFDSQAYLARGGYLLDLTEPGSVPNEMVLGCGDSATGTALLCGVLAGLAHAKRTDEGKFVNISLLNAAMWGAIMHTTLQQCGLHTPNTRKKPIAFALTNVYQCKDGTWVALNTSNSVVQSWKELCIALGSEEAANDERFSTSQGQREHREEAVEILDELFARKTYAEWDEILKQTNVAYERVAKLLEVAKDQQALENDCFIERHYPSGRDMVIAAPPFRMKGMKKEDLTKTVHFGEHTREVLLELGYCDETINNYYQDKIVF